MAMAKQGQQGFQEEEHPELYNPRDGIHQTLGGPEEPMPAAPAQATAPGGSGGGFTPTSGKLGDDQNYGDTSRDQFRDYIMGHQWGSQQEMDADLARLGATKAGANGTFTDPWGRTLDMGIGYKSGGPIKGAWTPVGGAGGGGGSFGGGGAAGPGGYGAAGGGGDLQGILRDKLLQLMGDRGPIDASNDPRATAFRNAQSRGLERQRQALAERAAASGQLQGGVGSGAFDTELQGLRENASENAANYEAGLVDDEVQARRQQLMQALQMADAIGARSESAALQRELAQLESQYKYAALGQQQGQFEDQMGFNYAQYQQNANRDAMLQLLYGG